MSHWDFLDLNLELFDDFAHMNRRLSVSQSRLERSGRFLVVSWRKSSCSSFGMERLS